MAPSPLTEAHIEAQRRLRLAVVTVIERAWRDLPGFDRADVPAFLDTAVPAVLAGQRQSVALTEAYLARFLGRQPLGVNPEALIGSGIRGADPREVYTRPFVTLWTSMSNGTAYEDAVNAGLARAKNTAAMDVQMSMRATSQAVQTADEGVYGYQRVADGGACPFCEAIDGAYVKFADAAALHDNCGCGLEPLTKPHPRAAKLPSGVAVSEHGELGAVLHSADTHFTGPSGLN